MDFCRLFPKIDKVNLLLIKCQATSRRKAIKLLDSHLEPSSLHLLYRKGMMDEISDAFGNVEVYPSLESLSLSKLKRLYLEFSPAKDKRKVLLRHHLKISPPDPYLSLVDKGLEPRLLQLFPKLEAEIYQNDASFSRIVAYTTSAAKTPEQRLAAKDVLIAFVEKQLHDQLFTLPLRDQLSNYFSFCSSPTKLEWKKAIIKIPSPVCQREISEDCTYDRTAIDEKTQAGKCSCSPFKIYRFVYPSNYHLDTSSLDEFNVIARGDFALNWIAWNFLDLWSLPHADLIAKAGSGDYFNRLAECSSLRNAIALKPTNEQDKLVTKLLHLDLLDLLSSKAVICLSKKNDDLDQVTTKIRSYLRQDPSGALTVLAQGLDRRNQMNYEYLQSSLRLRSVARPHLDLKDLVNSL